MIVPRSDVVPILETVLVKGLNGVEAIDAVVVEADAFHFLSVLLITRGVDIYGNGGRTYRLELSKSKTCFDQSMIKVFAVHLRKET